MILILIPDDPGDPGDPDDPDDPGVPTLVVQVDFE